MKITARTCTLCVFLCALSPVAVSAGVMLLHIGEYEAWRLQLSNPGLLSLLRFTGIQAGLSALCSVAIGLGCAFTLFAGDFRGKKLLTQFLGACFTLPSIVVASAIIEVYGKKGLLSQALEVIGVEYAGFSYGLPGILLGHIFLNAPFAALVLYHALLAVPTQNLLLLRQFRVSKWEAFRSVYLPYVLPRLKQVTILVFLMCFSSFALVLTLGKGPATNTLEVEIYQALRYDFDFSRAAFLALLQATVFIAVFLVIPRQGQAPRIQSADEKILEPFSHTVRHPMIMAGVFGMALFFVVPFATLVLGLFYDNAWGIVSKPVFWEALRNSALIATTAATLCLSVVTGFNLAFRSDGPFDHLLQKLPALPLFFSPIFIGAGLFILQTRAPIPGFSSYPTVIAINAIASIPFAHRMISDDFLLSARKYGRLGQALGLGTFRYFWHVDVPLNIKPLLKAWSLAAALSIGDVSVISLFGSEDFVTLPLLLIRLMGSYRNQESALVAAILCLLALALFALSDGLRVERFTSVGQL